MISVNDYNTITMDTSIVLRSQPASLVRYLAAFPEEELDASQLSFQIGMNIGTVKSYISGLRNQGLVRPSRFPNDVIRLTHIGLNVGSTLLGKGEKQ